MSKTFGLALGSGGSRGVAHIGVLLALEEAGIKPDFIAGCSMGAVIGGCFAAGMRPEQIRDIVLQLKPRDVLDIGPGFVSRMSLLRTKKLETLLSEYLGKTQIEDMQIPFCCIATDLYSGKLHVFKRGLASVAIQASGTIPCVFKPVRYNDMLLVDGGCLCRVPVKQVKDMGADVVLAVDALVNTYQPVQKVGNILDLVLRVFDIMDSQQTDMHNKIDGDIADITLKPELKDMSQYAIKDLDKAFEEGYKLCKENIGKIRSLIS